MNTTLTSPVRIVAALRFGVAALLACSLITACTSVQPVSSADLGRLTSIVKAGDDVTLTLRDGSTASFKVTAVENDAILGEGRRVVAADVAGAEIKRIDMAKSVLLGLAIAGGAAAAAAAGGGGYGGSSGGSGGTPGSGSGY